MIFTQVIAGFPGVGKTWLLENSTTPVSDSDSSRFSWESPGVRHPEWPRNYVEHVRGQMPVSSYVLVSTHKEVREALLQAEIPFTLVYPGLTMKEEYLQRYWDRGSTGGFVKLLEQNYESWIRELLDQQGCDHVILGPGQYLGDVL